MLIKSTTCLANTQGFFWKKSANAQNFCNFLALGQQQNIIPLDCTEREQQNGIHGNLSLIHI